MKREEARKIFVQNIVLDKAKEAVGQLGMNMRSSMSLEGVARFEDHHAKLKYNGRSGRVVFLLKKQEFRMVTNSSKTHTKKKETVWTIPSFEDPKFDPQKIIDIILSAIKRVRTIDIRYQKIDIEYDKTLRDVRSEFESLEGWE